MDLDCGPYMNYSKSRYCHHMDFCQFVQCNYTDSLTGGKSDRTDSAWPVSHPSTSAELQTIVLSDVRPGGSARGYAADYRLHTGRVPAGISRLYVVRRA